MRTKLGLAGSTAVVSLAFQAARATSTAAQTSGAAAKAKQVMKLWMRVMVLAVGVAIGVQAHAARPADPSLAAAPTKAMRLWYQGPAEDSVQGWLDQSLPLGNGYFGVNVFGGVARERLQITENSLVDTPSDGIGGLNNFAEVALEFPHAAPQDYSRDLDLDTATAHVRYRDGGVVFTREYFTSYPDRVMAIRLAASRPAALDFTLRPKAPYLTPFRRTEGDRRGKHATVKAQGDLITLNGVMDYYGIKFEAQFKVIPQGGVLSASNDQDGGAISVRGADSAVILVALGTNYRLVPQVFSEKDPLAKLKGFPDPHDKVTAILDAAAKRSFADLKARHQADYGALFGRVLFDLGDTPRAIPTDRLLESARRGEATPYLDELAFQFGRYLLISSSRVGALPPNLQGVWNVHQDAPWSAGYWHNVNQQMNYWPAFVTNLPELFDGYIDFYKAYLPAQQARATQYLKDYHPAGLSSDGDNGWAMGNSMRPFEPSGKSAHSGFGTGPWTTMLFWDRYDFTRDKALLRDVVYPAMRGQADFLSRFLTEKDGKLLAAPSSSPENAGSLQSVGTTFDQQMIFENYRDTIAAAGLLGVADDPVIARIAAQRDKLDPIVIGASGQIKEYREETTYGSIGDPKHRHISQLLGVYPGRLITSETPAWQDAAKVSLRGRGPVGGTGWAQAERIETWARLGEGDTAYQFYRYWMSHHAMSNLWNNHRDSLTTRLFQIDGNFGVSAGVGEMLLQSADGVVAPLAALPSAWPDGRYRGLLARGGFEVSAAWSKGRATRLEIFSKVGGPLTLRYPGLAQATFRTRDGQRVSQRPDARGDVSFDTKPGEIYVVTAIPSAPTISPVEDVKIAVDGYDAVLLTWRDVPRFKTYAVERAVGDSATYEQIASGLTQSRYVDKSPSVGAAQHLRYRIVGMTAAGKTAAGESIFRDRPAQGDVRYLGVDDDLVAYDAGDGSSRASMSDGRYGVDLAWAQGNLTEVRLTPGSSGQVRLRSPLFREPVEIFGASGKRLSFSRSGDGVAFDANAGTAYRIAAQAVVTVATEPTPSLGRVSVVVTVRAIDQGLAASTVTLRVPTDWRATPAKVELEPVAAGKISVARFALEPPETVVDGRYPVEASLASGDGVVTTASTVEIRIPNLALGRPAKQSSTVRGEGAARAVDGRTLGQIEAGSVTSTEVEDHPWWEVDLGSEQQIGDVLVWPRIDTCCRTAMPDLVVVVSRSPIGDVDLAEAAKRADVGVYHFAATSAPSGRAVVQKPGRYVRVWGAKRQELNLSEVQVFPSLGH